MIFFKEKMGQQGPKGKRFCERNNETTGLGKGGSNHGVFTKIY